MKQATANRPAKMRRCAKSDEIPDVRKLKLVSILKRGEPWISRDEALRRARANPMTNHGRQLAMKLAADLDAGRVLCKNWRVGQYVIFAKGFPRRHHSGDVYAWCVSRDADGFYCLCSSLSDRVYSDSRRLASK